MNKIMKMQKHVNGNSTFLTYLLLILFPYFCLDLYKIALKTPISLTPQFIVIALDIVLLVFVPCLIYSYMKNRHRLFHYLTVSFLFLFNLLCLTSAAAANGWFSEKEIAKKVVLFLLLSINGLFFFYFSAKRTPDEKNNPIALKGIRGWLLFYVILLVINLLSYSQTVTTGIFVSEEIVTRKFIIVNFIFDSIAFLINLLSIFLLLGRDRRFPIVQIASSIFSLVSLALKLIFYPETIFILNVFLLGSVLQSMWEIIKLNSNFSYTVFFLYTSCVITLMLSMARILYFIYSVRIQRTFQFQEESEIEYQETSN